MSIRFLLTMSHNHKLKVMRRDAGIYFPNDPTKEKVHVVTGEDFGERKGCTVEIVKSSCGVSKASIFFTSQLLTIFRSLVYVPSIEDPEIRMTKDSNHKVCSCASTLADDLLIIATDLEPIMEALKQKFNTRHDELNLASYLSLQ